MRRQTSAFEERPALSEVRDGEPSTGITRLWRHQRQTVIVTVAATLVVTAILSAVATVWNLATGQHPPRSDLVALLVASSLGGMALGQVVIRRARSAALRLFEPGIRQALLPGLREHVRGEFEDKIGLVEVYENFEAAKADLLLSLQNSTDIAIFLQLGRTIIAGGNDFYDTLMHISLQERAVLRVLHAGKESPYLSRRAAAERGSNYNRWQDDLRNAERKLATLSKEREQTVQSRQHTEGYVWQLFIFDDFAFVQPYLSPKSNSRSAPVLKFARFLLSSEKVEGGRVENRQSMYHAFARFFDLKWDERRPDATSLGDFIVERDTVVVAGNIIAGDGLHIFVLPRRYILMESRDIRFHCAGGKPHTDESLLDALRRELREELGVEFDVVHRQRMTRFVTSYAEHNPGLSMTQVPQPSIIYNRIPRGRSKLGR